VLAHNKIPENKMLFYVHSAQRFQAFGPEAAFEKRTLDEIHNFFIMLLEKEKLAGWQVRQAQDSLKILCQGHLLLPYALTGFF
jgi:hypothetical protein